MSKEQVRSSESIAAKAADFVLDPRLRGNDGERNGRGSTEWRLQDTPPSVILAKAGIQSINILTNCVSHATCYILHATSFRALRIILHTKYSILLMLHATI